jgi:hypothetical protein
MQKKTIKNFCGKMEHFPYIRWALENLACILKMYKITLTLDLCMERQKFFI